MKRALFLLALMFFVLNSSVIVRAESSWFADEPVVMHEYDYAAGFGLDVYVHRATRQRIIGATPFVPLVDANTSWLKAGDLIYGTTDITRPTEWFMYQLIAPPTVSTTRWVQIPSGLDIGQMLGRIRQLEAEVDAIAGAGSEAVSNGSWVELLVKNAGTSITWHDATKPATQTIARVANALGTSLAQWSANWETYSVDGSIFERDAVRFTNPRRQFEVGDRLVLFLMYSDIPETATRSTRGGLLWEDDIMINPRGRTLRRGMGEYKSVVPGGI